MDSTPNLALPYILAQQSQKHVTHNEAIRALDCVVQLAVLDRDLAAAPASPAEGDRYIVTAAATGAWSGHGGHVAAFQDGAWAFYPPRIGWVAWVADEALLVAWTGASWLAAAGSGGGGGASVNPTPLVGVNATADATNRLSVASPASLFSHSGSGHQLKINKAAAADTGSLLYQTAFSGRAELGLAGDDDFRVKVSADGTTWKDAIQIDRATGSVSMPFTTAFSTANLLVNGAFRINQRAFAGGPLAANAYGPDRWKAGPAGASLTIASGVVTLASGELRQIVETTAWGHLSLALTTLTLSVQDLSGGNLTVGIGSATGTIVAGSGRQAVTLTTLAGDTGNLTIRLVPAAGAVSFSRVKLEIGSKATPWEARPLTLEIVLCQRYFEQLSGAPGDRYIRRGYGTNTGAQYYPIQFFGQKRVAPTVSLLGVSTTNAANAQAFNPSFYEFEFYHEVSTSGGYTFFGYAADAEL